LLLLGAVAALACSGNKEPEPLPSQTVSQVTPQLQPPPPPAPPPVREIEPSRSSSVKVIEAGGGADQPRTLVEASQIAKARKDESQEPVAKITDENLHEYAAGADVIILESEPAVPSPTAAEPDAEEEVDPRDIRSDDYWRTRALELRMGWRRTVDRIQELELEAAALRQQFYAEEDPYIRDSQLKPAWDRVLDRLDSLRDRSAQYEQDLNLFIEEGRRAGALQGWLNQGWELEPTAEERERVERIESHQSIEPPVLEEDGR
jgi:hypothetical protein